MELPEIKKESYDCVGLYMNFSGGKYGDLDSFIGSLLTVKFVKDVLGYEHLVKNHKKLGLVYPEEVPGYKKILKQCMPYLGIVYNQKN
jgi:hypothetical protein